MAVIATNDWLESDDSTRYNVATGCRLEMRGGIVYWYPSWTGGLPTTVPLEAWFVAKPVGAGEYSKSLRGSFRP